MIGSAVSVGYDVRWNAEGPEEVVEKVMVDMPTIIHCSSPADLPGRRCFWRFPYPGNLLFWERYDNNRERLRIGLYHRSLGLV